MGPGAKYVQGTIVRKEPFSEGPSPAVGYLLPDSSGTPWFVGEGLGESIEGTAEPTDSGYLVHSKFGGKYEFTVLSPDTDS